MKKTGKKSSARQADSEPIQLRLEEVLRGHLLSCLITMGMEGLDRLLEEDRTEVCGPRYARDEDREAHRAGSVRGELVMGGRRVAVKRPRARTLDGEEIQLPTWRRYKHEDPLNDRAVEQMVVGVSTRKYDRSLEDVPGPVQTRGTSKSAVSRRFVATTQKRFEEWMGRDLSNLDLCGLMIDGVTFADHVVLVALGIATDGRKHVLGLWEGATENSTACKALLANLEDRGFRTDRSILAVIDGSKALAKALRKVFGDRALIQRCRVHKKRNVREHLPPEMHDAAMIAMSQAYNTKDTVRAKRLLQNLARRLESDHPGAAASLREGLDDTLTVKDLHLTADLERFFSCTNAVENLIGTGRDLSRRVKRWRGGTMVLRWMSTAMQEAEKKFRRIRGYKGLGKLVDALRSNDRRLNQDVLDNARQVA